MSSHDCSALVLKTYDVGEADRFAILLTDSCGRIGVRASGVRRPKSRLMGTVQSLQLLNVRVVAHRRGWSLTGAELVESFRDLRERFPSYRTACQGVALLLKMVEDDEPVPEVFAAAREYLHACSSPPPMLFEAFTVQLFSFLGLHDRKPSHGWIARVHTLSFHEQKQLRQESLHLLEEQGYNPSSVASIASFDSSVPSRAAAPTCSHNARGS